MKNKKIQLGIEEIRKIKMTEDEKIRIFNNIINTQKETRESIKSPWLISAFFFNFKSYQKMAFYFVIPLFIIFTSGAVAFASQDSLPNDILYPIKVKIVEPLEGALKFKQEAKATYQSNLASLRLFEAEILAKQDKLDEKKEDKLNDLLLEHTDSFHKAIDKASKIETEEKIEDMVTNFQVEMNVHARILDKIAESKDIKKNKVLKEDILLKIEMEKEEFENEDEDGIEKENKKKKVEKTNEKIKEENINKKENDEKQDKEEINLFKISETARLNANKIKEERKEKEKEDERENEKDFEYQEKNEPIQSLIEDIDKEIDSVLSD